MCVAATHARAAQDLGSRGYAAIGYMRWVTVLSLDTANSLWCPIDQCIHIHPVLYEDELGALCCSVVFSTLQLLVT